MDMKTALMYRGPFEEAYQQSREAEIVNQHRVAQAQQLLQEARLKAEDMEMKKRMEPYDIESKQAAAAFNRANTYKMMQEKPVDFKKMADAQASFQARLHPALQAIQAIPDPAVRQSLLEKLNKEAESYGANDISAILGSGSPEALKAYIDTMGRSKEAAKLQGIDKQGSININLQGLKGQQALDQINLRGKLQEKAAKIKAEAGAIKTENDIKKLQAKYLAERNNAKTEEERDYWGGLYTDVSTQIINEKSAAAVAGPHAKAQAAVDTTQQLMGGQGATSRGTGAANQVKPKVGADGWITLPDGTRVRQKPKE